MNKEDIKFLKELQEEIKEQIPSCWVIQEEDEIYDVSDNEDGYLLLDNNGEEVCNISYNNTIKDIYKWLKEKLDNKAEVFYNEMYDYICITIKKNSKSYVTAIENIDDLVEVLKVIDEDYEDYYIRSYRVINKISSNTFFITKEECEEHIRENGYHYSNPKPLCIKAWRSPQAERLYNILRNTNWDKIREDYNNEHKRK